MLCLDGEGEMNKTSVEKYVEEYLNNGMRSSAPVTEDMDSALDVFLYNTAKRLLIIYQKYKAGKVQAPVLTIALRNYLLTFQTGISLPEDKFLKDNECGIIQDASGKYYAVLDLPDYLSQVSVDDENVYQSFIDQVFQRKNPLQRREAHEGAFWGTNAFIYQLTGYKSFKSEEQKIAVFGALNTPAGYTTLVALPTGGGKSLITQTLAYQQEGLTIVVVPTVSLAIDQVRNAKKNIKHDADNEIFCYYSGIEKERKDALKNALDQETARLLFISPEALIKNTAFRAMIDVANKKQYLNNLIIDEAHIVIEWGDFFRVDYQVLEAWRNELTISNTKLRTILLSATYTRRTVNNLKQMFSSNNKWIEVRCDALRKEPRFILIKAKSYSDKRRKLIELVKKLPHPMIIYVNSPTEAEGIKAFLKNAGIDGAEAFHGKTKPAERERIIKDWTNDEFDLIIATSAFGVGVDKPDVRTVLHMYVPDTPNQYYQELGRGGRDGLASLSVMCILPDEDIDSAYKRMSKVLSSDKIWGRWWSMYKSPTSQWYKGQVTLDTDVKPLYNVTDGDDDATDIDIQWNVYVILILRRHNYIRISSMIYDSDHDSYKIRVEIINEALRIESAVPPAFIQEMRDEEAKGFESEIKRIKRGIDNSEKLCWSEMFFETYDLVSAYCGGCRKHAAPEMMEADRFPLLISVSGPRKSISSKLRTICQNANEVLIIGEEDNYSIINKYLDAGVSIIVLENAETQDNFDLLLNMRQRSNIMILGINEYRELRKMGSDFYVSGGVLAVYNRSEEHTYSFCNALRKYRGDEMCLIHLVKDDYFLSNLQKTVSSVIDGPKIDGYLLERM